MTWIIGRAGPFGHAVGVSDIRITLADGTEYDCLQKLYKIGNQLVLGFAGSVAIGLEAAAQMSTALNLSGSNGSWDPLYIAESLPIGTRKLFKSFPEEERVLGCQLMLLSTHPTQNDGSAPWARCFIHRYSAPDFIPVQAAPAQIVSIGSGSGIKRYADALKSLEDDMNMFKLEVGFFGGAGIALMSSLTSLLRRVPQPGISSYLQVCLVGRDRVRLGGFSREGSEAIPKLARNKHELNRILGELGVSTLEGALC